VASSFTESLVCTILQDIGDRFVITSPFLHKRSGPLICNARNDIVRAFLESTSCEWLLMVDADMAWGGADDIYRLLDTANERSATVVGGLCFKVDEDGRVGPTLYRAEGAGGYVRIDDFGDGVVEVDATGTAFLLVHRSAFEKVRQAAVGGPQPWFREDIVGDVVFGEDITFCRRLRAVGERIFVDTRVEVDHRKAAVYNRATWDAAAKAVRMLEGAPDDAMATPVARKAVIGAVETRPAGTGTNR